ncbi:thiosulfate oxidation carrier complex protein SoxZ [Sinimarinibacterium sp. CAU 1509]|uniref:thiosulfate oxidation carrier complex protein SoxZ n=1 Tax=Sinimarinibacterium sp. CAU 1509 TaxID=2562283 RepID=UPI001B7FCF67|nr:thiosulfate oxidation carrier complex protein SoxZ [Sinimarinibacterium sp. CAU 1509]
MASPMRIRAKTTDGITEVKALMSHPMETGMRKDAEGKPIPAHYITEVTATHNDKLVLHAYWGPAVSQNPFLNFQFKGGAAGDTVTIKWVDNLGESQTEQATLS